MRFQCDGRTFSILVVKTPLVSIRKHCVGSGWSICHGALGFCSGAGGWYTHSEWNLTCDSLAYLPCRSSGFASISMSNLLEGKSSRFPYSISRGRSWSYSTATAGCPGDLT